MGEKCGPRLYTDVMSDNVEVRERYDGKDEMGEKVMRWVYTSMSDKVEVLV
jgi:hypothetical protein